MGVTDYVTAFSEGWGVHFQRLAYDHTRIKNAQEMLSCEGVLATLFYQINSDKTLNLNSAGLSEIEVFIGKDQAPEFITKRKELGYFASLEQIRQLGFRVDGE